MTGTCWSEALQVASDPSRYNKSFYKRFIFVNYSDHGPSGDQSVPYPAAVFRTNPADSTIGTYNFGPSHLFRALLTGNIAGPGLNSGIETQDYFNRGAHFFWRPLTFAVAFVIPSDDGIAATDFLLQMGDNLYGPQTIQTNPGIASPGGNSIAISYRAVDLAFTAINRGPAVANRVVTDMALTAVADTPYIAVINLLDASVNFGIYDTTGLLLSALVTQNLASDFVTAKPVTVPGGHIFSGANTLSYPKIHIQSTSGQKSFSMFWYYFEDTMSTVPSTFLIGT